MIRLQLVKVVVGVLVSCLTATVNADMLTITSYSMLNGESGSQTYYDDTYGGPGASGDPNLSGSALSGGFGQLTDTLFAAPDDIFDDRWVGWFSIQPTITLDLGIAQTVNFFGVHASNWSPPFNDVGAPGSAILSYSQDNITYVTLGTHTTTATDRTGDDPRWIDLPFGGVTARYLRAQLFDGTKLGGTAPGDKPWIFIDEVRAEGISAVPEPNTTLLLLTSAALYGAARYRKSRSQSPSKRYRANPGL